MEFPIRIVGPGFVDRDKGNYQPGEYRSLSNAEITVEGELKERRSIATPTDSEGYAANFVNPFGIIGTIDDNIIYASKTDHQSQGLESATLWSPTSLPVPASGFHQIVAAFKYNKKWWWLTWEYDPASGGTYTYNLYYKDASPFGLKAGNPAFETLSTVALFTQATWPNRLVSSFIHKDRLWIVTTDRIYWSKATDPTVFATPDGGFVDISADNRITGAVALNDSVYIITKSSTYMLSYSIDPSDDGYMRKIADTGGDSICVHDASPYIANKIGLFAVTSTTVEKVIDLPRVAHSWKVVSFNEYLIFIARERISYDDDAPSESNQGWQRSVANPMFVTSTTTDNVYFLNTQNRSMHTVDFKDHLDDAGSEYGYIVDAVYVATNDVYGASKLYMITNKYVSKVAGVSTYNSNVYYMYPDKDKTFVVDYVRKVDGSYGQYRPSILVEFEGLSPESHEYRMRKFRTLLAMGKFPFEEFEVNIALDFKDYDPAKAKQVNNNNFPNDNNRLHNPVRLPINQRGHSISIKMRTTNPLVDIKNNATDIYDQFRISDLRLLWSYTKRPNVVRATNSTNYNSPT